MSFNPDPSKQVQEVFLTRKIKKMANTPIFFNGNLLQQASSQKHLGLTLDILFTFDKHKKIALNINPFVPNASFLYPLKTSENLTVCWCFQEAEKGCIGNKWVNKTICVLLDMITITKDLNP